MLTPLMNPRRENPEGGLAGGAGTFFEFTGHLPFEPFDWDNRRIRILKELIL